MNLMKFSYQVGGMDMGGRLPSALFKSICFPVYQVVQVSPRAYGITGGMHLILFVVLDFDQ